MAGFTQGDFTRTFTDKLLPAYAVHPRYIDSCGGTRSGKTYSVLQMLILQAAYEEARGAAATITSVVSETVPHLKRGAIRDFQGIMARAEYWDEKRWNKTDFVYRFGNGSIIEFFSADSPARVHGPARDNLFINEAQNIDWETARQLFVRTKDRIVLDYNPTSEFWVHERVQPSADCVSIHSTYRDNNFLSEQIVREIESNRGDANWWRVYGEGKVGVKEGLIYTFTQIDEMPERSDRLGEVWGLDFGFTNDPTAIVHVRADTGRRILYVQEVCYRRGMLNADIAAVLHRAGVRPQDVIYADCAEPKSIAEIQRTGIKIVPCSKDAPTRSDKLKFQLGWMQGWELRVTKDSVNLIRELRNYVWESDANGEWLNNPIDKWNHALDAMRYAVWSKWAKEYGYGVYNITFGQ